MSDDTIDRQFINMNYLEVTVIGKRVQIVPVTYNPDFPGMTVSGEAQLPHHQFAIVVNSKYVYYL